MKINLMLIPKKIFEFLTYFIILRIVIDIDFRYF